MPDSTGIGVLTLDRALRIQTWNHWLEAATGLAEGAVRDREVTELSPPARQTVIREVCAEVIEQGTTRVLAPAIHQALIACPPRLPSPHYTDMQQRVTLAPLRGDGGIIGLIATIEDLTERLNAERDLVAQAGAPDWRVRAAAAH